MLIALLSGFLLGAVIYDLTCHRLPNYYLMIGLLLAVVSQGSIGGWSGIAVGGAGLLAGFAVFLPFYIMGGMAAGDVKLMAVVGCFTGASDGLWAAAFSLMAGGVLGVVYLIVKGDFKRFLVRYWAMAIIRANIPADCDDAARHRFPYALAIFVGTLMSVYWVP